MSAKHSMTAGRSTHNYAHELAAQLGAELTDVTCSGAETKHMTEPQSLSVAGVPTGTAPPQFDALKADTTLVTLTIGGNDAGLVGIAEDCVNLDPTATPCKDRYTQGGVDQVAQRVGHDACRSAGTKWIEGYVPLNPAAPLHPNQRGEAAYAGIIAGHLG